MTDRVWQPIQEPIDFFDSVNGLVAQIRGDEIKTEIGSKIYSIAFSDDEPLLRVCEEVEVATPPVVPPEVAETIRKTLYSYWGDMEDLRDVTMIKNQKYYLYQAEIDATRTALSWLDSVMEES